jgi:hypothetical protein
MTDGALRAWGQRAEATKSLAEVAFLPLFLPMVKTLAYRDPPLLPQSPAPPPLILPQSAASSCFLSPARKQHTAAQLEDRGQERKTSARRQRVGGGWQSASI